MAYTNFIKIDSKPYKFGHGFLNKNEWSLFFTTVSVSFSPFLRKTSLTDGSRYCKFFEPKITPGSTEYEMVWDSLNSNTYIENKAFQVINWYVGQTKLP